MAAIFLLRANGGVMDKGKLTGALLATAVGLLFAARPLPADQTQAKGPDQNQSQARLKCIGGNSCKGQSACMSATNSCKGQNSCKGRGFVMTVSASECTEKGGHIKKQ
jgi:hypothetical protein